MPDVVVHESGPCTGGFARFFVRAARTIQAGQPERIRTLSASLAGRISPSHPFLRYGRARYFVAVRDGRPHGTAMASIHPDLPVGSIGSFEATDERVAHALLTTASAWLQTEGATDAVGPMDFSTWYAYRLRTLAEPGVRLMLDPDTPAAYADWWRTAGFESCEQYFTTICHGLEKLVPTLEEERESLRARGYRIRALNMDRFEDELRTLHAISREAFVANPYFVPIDFAEFRQLHAGARAIVDPRFVLLLEDPDGVPAGFAFTLPNRVKAVAAMRGSSSPLAKLRFARRRADYDSLIFKTLAVTDAHRSQKVGTGLFSEVHLRAREAGLDTVFHQTMHDTNHSRRISARFGGRTIRKYALFSRSLTGATAPT